MPFYEIAYETGRMSVAEYADDAEAQSAIGEHHRRAVNGEPGGPIGAPAERIRSVFVYPKHPDSFNEDQTMSADVAGKEVSAIIKDMGTVVNLQTLASSVAGLSHPFVAGSRKPFTSAYKMKEERELDTSFLEDVE